jgi:hypothetical protein
VGLHDVESKIKRVYFYFSQTKHFDKLLIHVDDGVGCETLGTLGYASHKLYIFNLMKLGGSLGNVPQRLKKL